MSKIAKALCDADVVKFGVFEFSGGRKSPVYINIRNISAYPETMSVIIDEMSKVVKKLDVNIVAGAELAGIFLASGVAIKNKMPMVYVRRRPKRYGDPSMIEGLIKKDDKAVLIDDMMTNGMSKLNFIEGIRHEAKVEDLLIVLDREQGGQETLEKEGVKLHKLITLKELIDYMRKNELVDDKTATDVLLYLKNPEEWASK